MSITISSQDLMPSSCGYGPSPYLAPVEHKIFDLQKAGKTEIEIAKELNLSLTEVSRRVEAIKRKIASRSGENTNSDADQNQS